MVCLYVLAIRFFAGYLTSLIDPFNHMDMRDVQKGIEKMSCLGGNTLRSVFMLCVYIVQHDVKSFVMEEVRIAFDQEVPNMVLLKPSVAARQGQRQPRTLSWSTEQSS